jgi:hypothetical protein
MGYTFSRFGEESKDAVEGVFGDGRKTSVCGSPSSRRGCHGIIMQNFVGTLVVDTIGVGMAGFGLLNPRCPESGNSPSTVSPDYWRKRRFHEHRRRLRADDGQFGVIS